MQHFFTYQDNEIDYLFYSCNEANFDLKSFLLHVTNAVKESKNKAETICRILKKAIHVKKELVSVIVAALMIITPIEGVVSGSTMLDKSDKMLILKSIEKRKEQAELQRISKIDPDFYTIIANRESANNWQEYNDYQDYNYIGKYQIGTLALLDTYHSYKPKYLKVSKGDTVKQKIRSMVKDFITVCKDSTLTSVEKAEKLNKIFPEHEQDIVMHNVVKNNEKYLRNFKKYVGQEINGVKITWSGMIAAAHLKGARSVKEYLESEGKNIPKDGFGTTIQEYMKLFK